MQGAKIHLGHGFLVIVGWALEGGCSLVGSAAKIRFAARWHSLSRVLRFALSSWRWRADRFGFSSRPFSCWMLEGVLLIGAELT
jgi:hypothetical protein